MDYQRTMRKGILAAKAGNSILARLHLQEAVELDPDGVDCWLWLAWVAESPESAQLFLERVLELDPQHAAARTGLNWTQSLIDFQLHDELNQDDLNEDVNDAVTTDSVPDHAELTCDEASDPQTVESVESSELTVTNDEPSTDGECSADSDVDMPADELETSDPVIFEQESSAHDLVDSAEDASSHVDSHSPETADIEGAQAVHNLEAESCFDTAKIANEEFGCSTEPTVCGDFTNEYCVQEAVVASVDEQLESLFASGQLLDQLESSDAMESDESEDEANATVSESDLATEPEPETESVNAVTERELEADSEPEALLDSSSEDAADDTSEPCEREESDAEPAAVEELVANDDDAQPTNAVEDAPNGVEEEPSVLDDSQQQPSDVSGSEPASSDDDGRPVIVVCDDSPTVRKLVCMSLEPHGFRVLTATDGVEGTALIQQVVPNLVLTDINMPEMDGYQLCKNVTKNPLTRNIPVVMLSGKDGMFDKLRGKLVGSTDHMSKPFSPRDLLRVVRNHLESCSVWSS